MLGWMRELEVPRTEAPNRGSSPPASTHTHTHTHTQAHTHILLWVQPLVGSHEEEGGKAG